MADPAGISGIRATGLRPVAILKKDNYRSWAVKLKVQLKVMECWELVTGTELQSLQQLVLMLQHLQPRWLFANHGIKGETAHVQRLLLLSQTRSSMWFMVLTRTLLPPGQD